jgi:hypothetical protein
VRRAQWHGAGADQRVDVLGHQAPRVEAAATGDDRRSQAIEAAASIEVEAEDPPPLDATHDAVMHSSRSVQTRPARHEIHAVAPPVPL